MLSRKIWLIPALLLNVSCTIGLPPANCPPDYCEWSRPLYFSDNESVSDDNARKINAMRDAGIRFCGWVKPE